MDARATSALARTIEELLHLHCGGGGCWPAAGDGEGCAGVAPQRGGGRRLPRCKPGEKCAGMRVSRTVRVNRIHGESGHVHDVVVDRDETAFRSEADDDRAPGLPQGDGSIPRIRRGMSEGSLNPVQANRALRELNLLRQDEARINGRLDILSAGLRLSRSDYDR